MHKKNNKTFWVRIIIFLRNFLDYLVNFLNNLYKLFKNNKPIQDTVTKKNEELKNFFDEVMNKLLPLELGEPKGKKIFERKSFIKLVNQVENYPTEIGQLEYSDTRNIGLKPNFNHHKTYILILDLLDKMDSVCVPDYYEDLFTLILSSLETKMQLDSKKISNLYMKIITTQTKSSLSKSEIKKEEVLEIIESRKEGFDKTKKSLFPNDAGIDLINRLFPNHTDINMEELCQYFMNRILDMYLMVTPRKSLDEVFFDTEREKLGVSKTTWEDLSLIVNKFKREGINIESSGRFPFYRAMDDTDAIRLLKLSRKYNCFKLSFETKNIKLDKTKMVYNRDHSTLR